MIDKDNIDKKILGQQLRIWRKKQNLTQKKLAEAIGVDEKTISRIERGVQAPGTSTLFNLFFHANLDIHQLALEYKKALDKQLKNKRED